MKVLVNGSKIEVENNLSVSSLIGKLNYPAQGIAIAVNEEIVPGSTWDDRLLSEGDRVEVVGAVQGG